MHKQNNAQNKKKKRGARKGKLSISNVGFKSPLFSGQVGNLTYEKQMAPASMGTKMRFSAPSTTSVAGGEIITGTSVLGELQAIAGTAFWEINPGLPDIFPQVAPTASLFSEYRFRKLCFRYVPSVGSNEQGRVIFVANRNVLDAPPTNFTEAASFEGATAVNVWEDMLFNATNPEWKFIRSSAYPEGTDPKTYDACRFTAITENFTSEDSPKGTIIMDYAVELRNRILTQPSTTELIAPAITCLPWSADDVTPLYEVFRAPSYNPIFSVTPPNLVSQSFSMQIPTGLWLLLFRLAVNDDYTGSPLDSVGPQIDGVGSAIAQRIGNPSWLQSFTLDTNASLIECTFLLYTPVSATVPDGDGSFTVYQVAGTSNIWEDIPTATDGQVNMIFMRLPLSAAALADPPLPVLVNAGPIRRREKSHFISRRSRPRPREATINDLVELLRPKACQCCKH